jgi:hypothetical protein
MFRLRASGTVILVTALMLSLVPGPPGRAAEGGGDREREVYEAVHQADRLASEAAREAYPIPEDAAPLDESYIEQRSAFREDQMRRGRGEVARRFGLSIDEVEAIRRRGDAEHWPLSDDPKPDPWSDAADRVAAGLLALSLFIACCALAYCVLFRRSLLVEFWTAAVAAWRWWMRVTGAK